MSKIEVNEIDKQSGSTLTLGGSGTAVTLACGATQTGFGRTGTVDWQTGDIKTSTFTATNGEGYFCDTSSGGFTANLPAGSAGAIVSFADYGDNFNTNALTISANGSDKISGETLDAVLESAGESVTLVFVDSTEGWVTVNASSENVKGSPFIVATGGTISCSGNCRIHTFTGPGTFTVSRAATCAADNVVSYAVVAGGASGGTGNPTSSTRLGGGGGAGGFREYKSPVTPYTASPLNGNPGGTAITVTATAFPITVGAGGTALTPAGSNGASGSASIFSTITSAGGGGGGGTTGGIDGGSGGGGGSETSTTRPGGSGNTPSVTPAQGKDGGSGNHSPGSAKAGGGGGAGAVGQNGTGGPTPPGSSSYGIGGAGVTTCITGSPVAYGGGGGGSTNNGPGICAAFLAGGTGGGGSGSEQCGSAAGAGTANTGGGGGGGGADSQPNKVGGNGGSGIVIIRYKSQ